MFVVNSLPVNVSAVRQFFADDPARDRQSESRDFAGLFGSEELVDFGDGFQLRRRMAPAPLT